MRQNVQIQSRAGNKLLRNYTNLAELRGPHLDSAPRHLTSSSAANAALLLRVSCCSSAHVNLVRARVRVRVRGQG